MIPDEEILKPLAFMLSILFLKSGLGGGISKVGVCKQLNLLLPKSSLFHQNLAPDVQVHIQHSEVLASNTSDLIGLTVGAPAGDKLPLELSATCGTSNYFNHCVVPCI